MKTRLLIIIATITISFLGYMQYVDAICMENQDRAEQLIPFDIPIIIEG